MRITDDDDAREHAVLSIRELVRRGMTPQSIRRLTTKMIRLGPFAD